VSIQRKIEKRRKRRALHVRARLRQDSTLARLTVYRSLRYIYAQIVDDAQQKTLVSCSSLVLEEKGAKADVARNIGKELAKRALDKGITRVAFDRGRFLYHGRVKALAEGAREGGLQF